MVGTIEPRKGHAHVLDAFDQLWSRGLDVNLVIVGAEGWRHLRPNMRRVIPQIIARLRSHPEWGRRLFWVSRASDEYLEKIYATSSCLIAAAEGEGFGLPLIEAARHGLPIIARDIPVFREVAGEHAFYFAGKDSDVLAEAIKQWLVLHERGEHPNSELHTLENLGAKRRAFEGNPAKRRLVRQYSAKSQKARGRQRTSSGR